MNQFRKPTRAKFLDYDTGDYFVTLCTKDKIHYFGEIIGGEMKLNAVGEFAARQLELASTFNSKIVVSLYVVMPNHIHAIVSINDSPTPTNYFTEQRSPNPSERANHEDSRYIPALSKYINSFKGAVTKFARLNGTDFGWQSRYNDHRIRGAEDGRYIAQYILNNVSRWSE